MLFGENIDHEALRKECETWCAATRMRGDAFTLNLPRVAERAGEIADRAADRGLRPEHVKAYLDGRL